jgi:hypothetical protein
MVGALCSFDDPFLPKIRFVCQVNTANNIELAIRVFNPFIHSDIPRTLALDGLEGTTYFSNNLTPDEQEEVCRIVGYGRYQDDLLGNRNQLSFNDCNW